MQKEPITFHSKLWTHSKLASVTFTAAVHSIHLILYIFHAVVLHISFLFIITKHCTIILFTDDGYDSWLKHVGVKRIIAQWLVIIINLHDTQHVTTLKFLYFEYLQCTEPNNFKNIQALLVKYSTQIISAKCARQS